TVMRGSFARRGEGVRVERGPQSTAASPGAAFVAGNRAQDASPVHQMPKMIFQGSSYQPPKFGSHASWPSFSPTEYSVRTGLLSHLTDTWPLSMISMIRPCMPVLSNTLSPTAGSRGSSFILSQMSPSHRRIGRNRRACRPANGAVGPAAGLNAALSRPLGGLRPAFGLHRPSARFHWGQWPRATPTKCLHPPPSLG